MSEEALALLLTAAVAPLADEIGALRRTVATLVAREGDRLLTQKEAAARLGVSTRTIRNMEAEGRLQRANASGAPRYTAGAVDAA